MRRATARDGTGKGRGAVRCAGVLFSVCCAATVMGVRAQDSGATVQPGVDNHVVNDGDTLWGISERYYDTPYDWPRLWSYNPEITNPHWIYPGHVVRLRTGVPGGTVAGGVANAAPATGKGKRLLVKRAKGTHAVVDTVLVGEQAYLDAKALSESATIVGSPDDHMMFSPSDPIFLKYDDGALPAEGQELSIFVRLHDSELSPHGGPIKQYHSGDGGEVVRVVGAVRVKEVYHDKKMALAAVVEAFDPVERGFLVADVPYRLTNVPPKPSQRKVEAHIVGSTRPLGTLGQNQLVFIDSGSDEGVEVGNRFTVVQRGDRWLKELNTREDLSGETRPLRKKVPDKEYPLYPVGEARVVFVRPGSCTALITHSLFEINTGDQVELREGY